MPNWENYTKPNLGLLFYKHIFLEDKVIQNLKIEKGALSIKPEYEDRQDNNKKKPLFNDFYENFYSQQIQQNIPHPLGKIANNNIDLYTTYPGLTMGTGYDRETKTEGDFKIGFFFDHTTGQPILPGSSVKGVLRSLFELDVDAKGNENTGEKSVKALQFIFKEAIEQCQADELKAKLNTGLQSLNEVSLNSIKQAIFGGQDKIGTDIFFDAVINFETLGNEKFLSNDFITPHQPNLLKNPIPLMFLKVLPNVPFQFRFKLSDEGWEAEVKEVLFKTILLTIGAGAKTNVGYGQFVEQAQIVKMSDLKSNSGNNQNRTGGSNTRGSRNQLIKPKQTGPGLQQKLSTNLAIPEAIENQIKKANYGKIKRGDEVYGQVIKTDRKFFFVQILIEENQELITKVQQSKKFKNLAVGTVLHLKVTNLANNDKLDCSIIKKVVE